ncbi:MAG: type II secretion system protein GspK [Thermodesulfobacteriota bacterium]|nr:type II secretion system protein GspK [Thermodesulfobacteriota bacterium]
MLVLVCLLALTGVVLAVLDQAFYEAREPVFLSKECQAGLLAVAGLAMAKKMLLEDGDDLADTPLNSWAKPWEDEKHGLKIVITPCNAFLNLNNLNPGKTDNRVQNATRVMLNNKGLAPENLESLLDWLDPDKNKRLHGAEDSAYILALKDYTPRNKSLTRPEEALLALGWETVDPVWFGERFTVWGEGGVNLNFASEELIKAFLPELENYFTPIQNLRQDKGFTSISELDDIIGVDLRNKIDEYVTVSSKYFRVIIEVKAASWMEQRRYVVRRDMNDEKNPISVVSGDVLRSATLF